MARVRVVLSVPKEDDISLPDSRLTYRPYVDPTHKHYYTRDSFKGFNATFRETTPVRPTMVYAKCGVPEWLCKLTDKALLSLAKDTSPLHANLIVVIDK